MWQGRRSVLFEWAVPVVAGAQRLVLLAQWHAVARLIQRVDPLLVLQCSAGGFYS